MTEARSLSVEQAIKVLRKGGEVVSVYAPGRNFLGRFEATTDEQISAIWTLADQHSASVQDWATGENA